MPIIRISSAFAVAFFAGLSLSSSAYAVTPSAERCTTIEVGQSKCCTQNEIVQAKALANKAIELSKTDATAALKIAENVAKNNKSCFQVAFGSVLDGTGTASLGLPLAGLTSNSGGGGNPRTGSGG